MNNANHFKALNPLTNFLIASESFLVKLKVNQTYNNIPTVFVFISFKLQHS